MARFQRGAEIYDLWIADDGLLKRRFAAGTAEPAPVAEPLLVAARFADDERDAELAEARRRYCELHGELLRDGWRRIHDPAREVAYPDDPRVAELEAALHANPDDDVTWLVYADHLIERGHPRGALIALDSAPVNNVVARAERDAEATRLRLAATDELAGALAQRRSLSLYWHRGYIREARIHGAFCLGQAEDLLFELLAHPAARFLRELVIDVWHHDSQDHRTLVDLLLHHAPPPPLRKLTIEHRHERWLGFPPLGDVGALAAAYPQLEELALAGDNTWDLGGLEVPRAKRFALQTTDLRPGTLRSVLAAPWPVLEELALWFGAQSACTIDDLRPIFDGTTALPALTTLRLLACALANDVVTAFVRSPLARRLTRLDLRHGSLDDDAVATLVRERANLSAGLRVLAGNTRVTEAGRDRLRDADLWPEGWR